MKLIPRLLFALALQICLLAAPALAQTITRTLTIPGKVIAGLDWHAGTLWVTHFTSGVSDEVIISSLNPATGAVLSESSVLPYNGRDICFVGGDLWITDAVDDVVRQLDPVDFHQISSFDTPGSEPWGLTYDGTNLWMTDPFYTHIYQLTTTGSEVSSFPIPNEHRTGLHWANGGLWTPTDNTTISHYTTDGMIDSTLVFETLANDRPIADAVTDGTSWFVAREDTIFVIPYCCPPPPQESVYCVTPNLAIRDHESITSEIVVPGCYAVSDVKVDVNIEHTYVGDLIVELRHGGTSVRLHDHTGGFSSDLIGTYPTTFAVDGPGALADFVPETAGAAWTLFISDDAGGDTGTLVSWCLRLTKALPPAGVEPGSSASSVSFAPASPNPSLTGATTLRWAMARAGSTTMRIYDLSGRLVRTLVDESMAAGEHSALWNTRDSQGRRVAAGIYLCRLQAPDLVAVRRVIVLR